MEELSMGTRPKLQENYFDSAGDMMKKFAQLNANSWKSMNDVQLRFANLWMEFVKKSIERISAAKKPEELFDVQSDLMTEYTEKFSDNMREAFDTVSSAQTKLMEDFFEGCTNPFFFSEQMQKFTGSKGGKGQSKKITVEEDNEDPSE